MRIADSNVHLTYCLNVHPGESWAANFAAIREQATVVKQAVCPDQPFGLGLRLGAQAVAELRNPPARRELRDFLAAHGLYAFTVNAFPYGNFHASPVKESVYRPDWTSPLRRDYTLEVARLLADLLPEGVPGSISTVPIGFKAFGYAAADLELACAHLAAVAVELAHLESRTGRHLCLALEPEPDCLLETTDELLHFFQHTLPPVAEPILRRAGLDEASWRRHLGVCYDTTHAGVQFEDMLPALARLRAAGLRLAKVQLGAALATTGWAAGLAALRPFVEPVYLHQTRIRHADGQVERFVDLPQALATVPANPADDWRVHYHVPLFWTGDQALGSTAGDLPATVRWLLDHESTHHLEIETYTFTVLPPALAPTTLAAGLAAEFHWLLAALDR